MTPNKIIVHPSWLHKAGAGDIVRHFQLRGFDVSNQVGSRFFTVSEKKTVQESGFEFVKFWRTNK